MKRVYILLCIILAFFILGGAYAIHEYRINPSGQEEEMSTEFTAQQLQILEKEGVPADYDEMTDMQKEFLERADKMMTYLYDKYNEYGVSFVYDGYHPAAMFEAEWMIAYPEGGDPELDKVTVERVKGNEDVFEDNYLDVATRPYYAEVLDDYFSQYFDPGEYQIYVYSAELNNMEVSDLSNLNKEFVENREVMMGTSIYISEEACTPEELEEFVKGFHAWLYEHQYWGRYVEFLFMKEGMEQMTAYNHVKLRHEYGVGITQGGIYEDGITGEGKVRLFSKKENADE